MAEIRVPIQINLPDDWVEQIVNHLKNDPDAEWAEIIRCKDCKFYREYGYINGKPKFLPRCGFNQIYVTGEDYCSRAERRADE